MKSLELECHNGQDVHTLMSIVRLLFSSSFSILKRCCRRNGVDGKDGAIRVRSGIWRRRIGRGNVERRGGQLVVHGKGKAILGESGEGIDSGQNDGRVRGSIVGDEASRAGAFADIPFEFVGEVASAGAMAEATDIESCATARRHRWFWKWVWMKVM